MQTPGRIVSDANEDVWTDRVADAKLDCISFASKTFYSNLKITVTVASTLTVPGENDVSDSLVTWAVGSARMVLVDAIE